MHNIITDTEMRGVNFSTCVERRDFENFSYELLLENIQTFEEIKFNSKFVQMYRESEDGRTTILELNKLNEHKEL